MPKVLCTLPNASELINGIAFEATDQGMLSVTIDDDTAAQFSGIAGYTLVDDDVAGKSNKKTPTPPAE